MCHTVTYAYAKCGSTRSTTLFPCEAGYSETSGCNANKWSTKVLEVTAPSYCPNCYRAREDHFCEEFDIERRELEESIQRALRDMHQEKSKHDFSIAGCWDDVEELEKLKKYRQVLEAINEFIIECQETLEDIDSDKMRALKDFRAEQGVWGDG